MEPDELDPDSAAAAVADLWTRIESDAQIPRACIIVPLVLDGEGLAQREREVLHLRRRLSAAVEVLLDALADGTVAKTLAPSTGREAEVRLLDLDVELMGAEQRLKSEREMRGREIAGSADTRWPDDGPLAWEVDHVGWMIHLLEKRASAHKVTVEIRDIATLCKYGDDGKALRPIDASRGLRAIKSNLMKNRGEFRRGRCETCGRIHQPSGPPQKRARRTRHGR